MSFSVAIVGRPNVGKSTLFNRLIGKRLALVDDTPGVTRDRREGEARLGPMRFRVFDTAGLEEAKGDTMEARMRRQTEKAVADADAVLFLFDARAGVTPLDRHFADLLRRTRKPVLVVANKCEGRIGEEGRMAGYALGLGEPVAISAEHGEGLADLYEALRDCLPEGERDGAEAAAEGEGGEGAEPEGDLGPKRIQLAIVGRPNAGKSTLINRLLGEERLLTGPEAGLTRDAIAVDWTYGDHTVRLVDTAGMRRQARVEGKLERLAVAESLRAIRLAQVVVLVVDATRPLEKQDLAIADHVVEEGRALVVAVNKWDLVEDRARTLKAIQDRIETGIPQLKGVALVTLSAKTGRHLERLMPAVLAAYERWNRRLPTPRLNRWLAEATTRHPPPAVKGRRLRLRYATQVKTRPPTFALFCSQPGQLPESYLRYLSNALREVFDLAGTPLRIHLRKSDNPYVNSGDR
ncbi:MAG: ribosome biogenesis GTPase Der [Alphaproteobacteria bacterium]|nr:ribosome biogenesis GTPase Der [Alphaproteobacteria bacterium]